MRLVTRRTSPRTNSEADSRKILEVGPTKFKANGFFLEHDIINHKSIWYNLQTQTVKHFFGRLRQEFEFKLPRQQSAFQQTRMRRDRIRLCRLVDAWSCAEVGMGCMLPSKFPGVSEPDIDHPTNGERMVDSWAFQVVFISSENLPFSKDGVILANQSITSSIIFGGPLVEEVNQEVC